jgi:capsid protein
LPFYREWLDVAVLSGRLKINDYFQNRAHYRKPKFTSRGWPWVDPLKEVNANIKAVKAGFKTLTEIAAESGKDFEDIVKTRRRELDLLATYQIDLVDTGSQSVEPVIMSPREFQRQQFKNQYKFKV